MKVLLKLRYKEKAWNGSLTHPARDQSSRALFEETRNYKTQEPVIVEYRQFLLLLLSYYHHLQYYHDNQTPKVLIIKMKSTKQWTISKIYRLFILCILSFFR